MLIFKLGIKIPLNLDSSQGSRFLFGILILLFFVFMAVILFSSLNPDHPKLPSCNISGEVSISNLETIVSCNSSSSRNYKNSGMELNLTNQYGGLLNGSHILQVNHSTPAQAA